jgi:ribosome-binding factor A
MSQRTERVDELLRQEIGALLTKEIADPRIGFATITEVETAPDLRHAKVWVSVIGGPADRDETLRALAQAMPFIRHELGKRLRIKRIPALHVRLDDSAERGTRVLHLLQELEAGADPNEIEPYDESLPTPVKRLHHETDAGETAEATEPLDPASDFGAAAAEFLPPPGKPTRRRTGGPKGGGTGHGPKRPSGSKGSRPSSGHGGKR